MNNPTTSGKTSFQSLPKTLDELNRLHVVSTKDFVYAYFDALPYFKTASAAFDNVNQYYFERFGELKYTDFTAFRESLGFD